MPIGRGRGGSELRGSWMTEPAPPILQVRQGDHATWHVAIIWQDGRTETTSEFSFELEAKEWARTSRQTWLEGRKARVWHPDFQR